jgi:tryptophan synthase alpha chain
MVRNRLDAAFASVRSRGRKALVAYLAAGYPRFSEQTGLVQGLEESGVDILEVGIPFSDPVADGPTIQFASHQSLRGGTTVRKVLAWVRSLSTKVDLPIVFMTYMNPVLAYGLKKFAAQASAAGVTGVIVPDLIPEESGEISKALTSRNIHLIHLVAPTTPKDRMKLIARKTSGFLYAVSVAGVTGARRHKVFSPATRRWLRSLQKLSPHPVCVGFGISGPEQVKALRGSVDGFIVGSALIDIIRKQKPGRRKAELNRFVRGLAKECARGR